MIIYITNILLYSKMANKHMEHLEYVLSKLWKNKFFAIRTKNEFAQEKMDFLGHILSKEGVRLNLKKL